MTSCARVATSIRFESTENEMAERAIRISEARSNLSATAQLFADEAPVNIELLWQCLETARSIPQHSCDVAGVRDFEPGAFHASRKQELHGAFAVEE